MQFARFLAILIPLPLMFGAINSPAGFHWTGKLPPGQTIEVKGVNGGIQAQPTDGDEVEVVAHKTGQFSDPSAVQVKVVEHEGGVTVCAVYPSIIKGDGACQPGPEPPNLNGNDVQVDFLVRVPNGVRFIGRTVNGKVEAARLNADAEAHSVNGDIRLSTRGLARADTVNGSIRAVVGKVDDAAKFATVNGGITLEVARGTHAEVRARTVNGAISTNFPLVIRGRLVNKRAYGRIGGGGPELELNTVNGSITLHEFCDRPL
jgi:putative adhesin